MIKLTLFSIKNLFTIALSNIILIVALINSTQRYLILYCIILELILLSYYLIDRYHKISHTLEQETSMSQLTFNAMSADYNKKVEEVKITVNELNTAYEELQILNSKMVKSQNEIQEISDYRGKFLINMSHELRTPLNAIIGFTSIMKSSEYSINPEEQSEMVEIIHKSSNKLLGMINNILELTKIETNTFECNPEFSDIADSFELAASMAKGMLKDKPCIIFTSSISNDFPFIYCDTKSLNKVIIQLLDNAVKFTMKGEISMTTSFDDKQGYIHIKDTGCGINTKEKEDLFEPFITMLNDNDTSDKTGIGLAISKSLMDEMDAEILINSVVDHGTTVTLKFKRG